MDGAEQTPIVEPIIDPSERRHFQVLLVSPRPLTMDQLGFAEAVHRFCEGVVHCPPLGVQARLPGNGQCMFTCMRGIGIPDTSDRWLDSSCGQTFGVADRQILPAAVAVMYQPAFLNRPSVVQGLFKCLQDKVWSCRGFVPVF